MCELSPVAFHGDTVFCIEFNGQPFTPMKPIVENLGLAWQAQAAKLSDNKERWSVTIIVTVAQDGKEREMLCLPVRKLPAWLASINPNKVREELRPKIELYQAECDDALWNYWMNGRAERNPVCENGADAPITPDQQCTLQGIVKAKVDAIPEAERNTRGLYPQVWQRFNNHFRLAKYAQLPQSRMSEAVEYLVKMELKPVKPIEPKKELPSAREKLPARDKYESYMEEVEAFRARSAVEIEVLLRKGLDLVNVYKFGPGGIEGFTTILLDWLQSVAGQHAPLIRYREPLDRAIAYSPLCLMKHMEAVLPDVRK